MVTVTFTGSTFDLFGKIKGAAINVMVTAT